MPVRGLAGLKQVRYERPHILRYLDCLNGLVPLATVVKENEARKLAQVPPTAPHTPLDGAPRPSE